MPGTCSSDIPATEGVGETEFDMLTSNVDLAIERAVALPEFVSLKEDDIIKATAFRFVDIAEFNLSIFVWHYHCHLHLPTILTLH